LLFIIVPHALGPGLKKIHKTQNKKKITSKPTTRSSFSRGTRWAVVDMRLSPHHSPHSPHSPQPTPSRIYYDLVSDVLTILV
jgi:hypothetical protein